ncbi:tetratricopeptide repeat protein [Fulvivirga sediminis]|uniref:Tetratricopeptide repeat protein n=1 Tax=Fulvivirga sediminis TaxID=2803949 RepID=A0A937K2Q3_9BACT|nr:tetratricopeptide repeat protein [Fulvivirga sediminis]MBL3658077.1 tetratricopeptide repeat protein [Fulvivirga sediminis]
MRKGNLFMWLIMFFVAPSLAQENVINDLSLAFKKARSEKERIDLLNELAYHYTYSNLMAASDDVAISYEASKQADYQFGQAKALNVKGTIEWNQSNYAEALKFFLEALDLFKVVGDSHGALICYNNIAEIYKKLGEMRKGLKYLMKAQALQLKAYGNMQPLISVNIGEVYLHEGNYDSATFYFMEALNNDDIYDRAKSYAYDGLAGVAQETRDLDAATYFNKRALEIRKAINEQRAVSISFTKLADLAALKDDYSLALSYFDSALVEARKNRAKDLKMDIYERKAQMFRRKGDYEEALQNYMSYAQLKDSVFNEQKANQMALLQTRHQTELLKHENETTMLALKYRNQIIFIIVPLLLVTLLISYLLYKKRKAQKYVIQELAEKNSHIQMQAEELQAQSEKVMILNNNLENLNTTLEDKIKERTRILKEQNKVLAEYAYINAHELRAPVATVMGLVNLLKNSKIEGKEREIIEYLAKASSQLDSVIKNLKYRLERHDDSLIEDEEVH